MFGAGTGATSIVAGPATGIAIGAGVVGVAAGVGAAMLGDVAGAMVASGTDGGLGGTATGMIGTKVCGGGGPRAGAGGMSAGGMSAGSMRAMLAAWGRCWRHGGDAGGMGGWCWCWWPTGWGRPCHGCCQGCFRVHLGWIYQLNVGQG